jgi:uncharacterized protein (DUF1800 family)
MTDSAPTRREALKLGALAALAAAAAACQRTGQAGYAPATSTAATPTPLRPTRAPTSLPAEPAATSAPVTLPAEPPVPLEIIVWNRLAFGPRPGDLDAWRSRDAAPEEVLAQWLEEQLNPETLDDSDCDARLEAAGLSTLNKSPEQIWQEHVLAAYTMRDFNWELYAQPMYETVRATLIRMTHSRRQLFEVLVDFWHNHFNVFRETDNTPPHFLGYDRDVIRPHALGNFRQMLEAVATSPAMLYYLDNYNNQVSGPNENYARELFELHTLGAENYLGVRDPNSVEKMPDGVAVGYVDNDVYEAARAFTGWRVADDDHNDWEPAVPSTGKFFFYKAWHDRFNKLVLGRYLPADPAPMEDGRAVLDLLAYHPGTARYVCRKLCRRLISDQPPESVVQRAAEVFLAQRDAPDQIKHVVRAIVLSDEFKSTWGEKIKRPLEAVIAMLRALDVDVTRQPDSLLWYLDGLGQPPFGRRPPDGYPDRREAWSSTSGLLNRWNFGVALVEGWISDEQGRTLTVDLRAQTPPELDRAHAITDFWIDRLLGRPLQHAADRDALVRFLAGDYGPDEPLPADHLDWRLPGLVELILMSPEFHTK